MRDQEDFELIKVIDKNLEFAMAELGDDIYRYLDEAEKTMNKKYKDVGYVPYHEAIGIKKPEKKEVDVKKLKDKGPFSALAGGFVELGSAFIPKKSSKKGGLSKWAIDKEKGRAKAASSQKCWLSYKNYKKSNKMITW